jgi:hypothetical protein
MKRTSTSQNWLAAAIAGLALAFATSSGLAVPDRDLGTFDSDISGTGWLWGIGWGNSTREWDGSQDNTGNGGGSLHVMGSFDRATSDTPLMLYGISDGNPWWHPTAPPYDMSVYKSLDFDIKWDADPANMSLADFNSPPGGGVQGLQINACPDGATSGVNLATTNIPSAAVTGWTHISIPINPTLSGLGAVYGVWFDKWLPTTNPPASFGFWLDNVVLKGSDAPPPPPTILPLAKPVPGVAFIAASTGQYDRQEIRTSGSNYTWIGASAPVSYAVDVAKIGENNPSGFTFFEHFVPGIADPTRPDSDWHEANVLMLTIGNNADGSAWASLRYKTNAPESNGNMWDTGALPNGVGNPTPAGTWTVTFNPDSTVVISAPEGGTATNTIPPEVVDIFKATPNMQVNFGGTPGELSRLGQMAVITGLRITGAPGEPNLSSDFVNQPLDTNAWMIVATSAKYGVQQISKDAAYWMKWTLPANGFSLETKATLDSGAWTGSTVTGYEAGGVHTVLLNRSDMPGVNSGFFRLIKRVGTQLQVLLPGETNAPDTASGKVGTPDPQTLGNPFDLTVNMCDPTWHIVSSSDTVTITSSDLTAWLPPNANLANGTVTITGNFFFQTSGTWTISATDVTNPAITPGTSTAITVP